MKKKEKILRGKIMTMDQKATFPPQKTEERSQVLQETKEQEELGLSELSERSLVYHYKFSDLITETSVRDLINNLHQHDVVVLRFSTPGGDFDACRQLIDYLNQRNGEIFVVFDFILFSCGFLTLLGILDCEYTFDEMAFECAMVHKVDVTLPTQREVSQTKLRKRNVVKLNKYLRKELKELGMSSKQLKKFDKGKDVVLKKKHLKKLNIWK